MFASDVTTRALSDAAWSSSRTAVCRRSSAALGACAMNGGEPLLELGNLCAKANVLALVGRVRENVGQLGDRAFQLGIVWCEPKGGLVLGHRPLDVVATAIHVADGANRRQVLRRPLQHRFEFLLGLVELPLVQERSTEGDAGG